MQKPGESQAHLQFVIIPTKTPVGVSYKKYTYFRYKNYVSKGTSLGLDMGQEWPTA